jgi:hypothetical protein
MIEGDFEGIGAYVEESPNGIYVSGVLPGSPAQNQVFSQETWFNQLMASACMGKQPMKPYRKYDDQQERRWF